MNHPFIEFMDYRELSLSDIARACGVTPQAVYEWRRLALASPGWKVPANRVRALCSLGGTPHDLRPDLFDESWTYEKGKSGAKRR